MDDAMALETDQALAQQSVLETVQTTESLLETSSAVE